MTTKKCDFLQQVLNNIEIEGLSAMFSEFYADYMQQQNGEPYSQSHGFFYSDNFLQSEDEANGTPIYFEGLKVSHLAKRKDGDLTYLICQDNSNNERLVEFSKYNGHWYMWNKGWSKIVKNGKCW